MTSILLVVYIHIMSEFGDRQGALRMLTDAQSTTYTDANGEKVEIAMPAADMRAVHKVLFSMLRAIDSEARRLNVTYTPCGGTLIGALRHGGFVPWDGDADIVMLPSDFHIFLHHAKLPAPLWLQTCTSDKNYHGLGSILGCSMVKVRHLYSDYSKFSGLHHSPKPRGIQVDITAPTYHQQQALPISTCYTYAASHSSKHLLRPLRFSFGNDSVQMNVPRNAEKMLRTEFGNWRQLLPVRKRRPHEGPVTWDVPQNVMQRYAAVFNHKLCQQSPPPKNTNLWLHCKQHK